ncbi:SpoIIE family protein phosphatase [Peptoclostridium acidaminophilum]|nr:SpoIIE family protein phosphatase [Peptoclostridium acidaminophilum]
MSTKEGLAMDIDSKYIEELQEQKAMTWLLGEVIKISSNIDSFIGLMEVTTDMLMGVMGLDTCTIWMKSDNGFKSYSRGIQNENRFLSEESSDFPTHIIHVKDTCVFDTKDEQHWFIQGKSTKSVLLSPLNDFKNKERVGIIIAEHSAENYFTNSKIDFFGSLSIQISIASENAKHFEEERRKAQEEVRAKNEQIVESVHYASMIQNSLLPDMSFIKKHADDAFAIWKPKDIVGGDFYWFAPTRKGFCAVLMDCTGHGVAGAFMTIALNQMISRAFEDSGHGSASEILNKINAMVKDTFYKFNKYDNLHAGLDMGLCMFDQESRRLTYSGARMSLFSHSQGITRELRGANKSLGYSERKKKEQEFEDAVIDYLPGDAFYMTTDGFLDQNGYEDIHPFGAERFVEAIDAVAKYDFEKQRSEMIKRFSAHKGCEVQRDDVTVFAVKPL